MLDPGDKTEAASSEGEPAPADVAAGAPAPVAAPPDAPPPDVAEVVPPPTVSVGPVPPTLTSPGAPKKSFAENMTETAAGMDVAMARLIVALRSWALWPFALAICTGAGLWDLHALSFVPTLDTNKLGEKDRIWMGVWVACAFLTIALVYLATMMLRRQRTGVLEVTVVASDLNKRFFPLLALPLVAAIALPNIEKDSPKQALFYAFVVSVIVARGVYAWARPANAPIEIAGDDAPERPRAWHRYAAWAAVAALGIGYGLFFSRLSILNHHALNTRVIDLGYYDNIFYQSIHGHPLGCSFIKAGYHGSAHFDPLLILLSPFYLLYPHAEFLLVLQAFWLGAGVIPLYLGTFAKLGRRLPAVVLCAMYVVHPALEGANMYEFHSLTLITPVMLWMLYFLETRNITAYWPTFAIALLTREDISLLSCFVGAYAILLDKDKLRRVGWATIGISVAYFVLVKRAFMTSPDIFMSGKDSYSYAYYYEDLIPNKTGLGGMLLTLVTNPVFLLKTVVAEAKVQYFLTLFVPLFFLPFFDKPGRLMLVYGLLFTLLASRTAVFSPHFQYSNLILPFAFTRAASALKQIEDSPSATFGIDGKRLSRGLLAGAFVASLLVSWKFGGIVDNAAFKGGFVRVARHMTEQQEKTYAWIRDAAAQIPEKASVGTTNKLGPHVSNRMGGYFYPEKNHTDYVLIDESELKGNDLEKHNKAVKQGQLVQLSRHDRMALFKRNHEKTPPPTPSSSSSASAPPQHDTDPQRDHEKEE